jgi:hypothetical protein
VRQRTEQQQEPAGRAAARRLFIEFERTRQAEFKDFNAGSTPTSQLPKAP